MQNRKSFKKAFTLVELAIVLALIAIISVVSVSICLLFSTRTKSASNKLAFMQELNLLKMVAEQMASDYPEEDLSSLLSFDHNTQILTTPDKTYNLNQILIFNIEQKENNGDLLYICKVISANYNEHFFTVNSFVGEQL